VNILGNAIKGGTNPNFSKISLPPENIDSSNNNNNSISHLMPSFDWNTFVGLLAQHLNISSAIIITRIALMTTVQMQRHH